MDSKSIIDVFDREIRCEYKGRHYLVRDNGAVFRLPKQEGRCSRWDNVWTFGRPNEKKYLMIGNERVHRIVCTAFHGEPEGARNVVDHIDTNHGNNRPENLHWVTRMENILNNPITMAKVELICGSREAFIANPQLLFGHESEDPNFSWMRNVSPAEAKESYDNWMKWAEKSLKERRNKGGSAGEWLYGSSSNNPNSPFYGFQRWTYQAVDRTEDSYFPLAPIATHAGEDVLQKYREALVPGADFLISRYYKTVVTEVVYFEKENKLRVLSERVGAQRIAWYIIEIWPENNILYHRGVGNYGKKKRTDAEAALHDLSIVRRQEWKYKYDTPTENRTVLPPPAPIEIRTPEQIPFIETNLFSPADNIEQRNWSTPTEFPMCPSGMPDNPLEEYKEQMVPGDVFCRNIYGDSFLVEVGESPEGNALIVLTIKPDDFKKWYLCRVYIENDLYIHESIGSFFEEDGVRKYFTIHTGGEWTGREDLWDDFDC